ncbi:branched-chain amino acid transport protein AzlD [Clostridium puniceum]|uniref:Branched-chain amino acid transport protein AzlD n=1 Tax=Clostridium puniceum TaxID=29367 RepID=A0A1S8T0E1_9CLOT|nr:branched-chain amino acid transporter permease [Clostridium puniceum]OOM71133.1 branched-chain amino acid transport protein AzlD [Clostridium puniceum]
MTTIQQIITIGMVVLGTQFTRWIAFISFPSNKPIPSYIEYLGKVLPPTIFGMLVVYCYKNINIFSVNHGIPELIAGIIVVCLQLWKKNMFLSIATGTILYMFFLQAVF